MCAGETKTITVTCRNKATGALIDFTNATGTWRVKSATSTVLTKTIGSGITGSASGVLTITIATGDTTGFDGEYRHACRVTLSDSTVTDLFDGILFIETSIAA
jgi:hypothetical protein